jgi:quercetin dioxygenase-like cupin family protein
MKIRKIWDSNEESVDEKLLFDRPETETIALGYVSLSKGESTSPAIHIDEEEIYVVLGGEAELHLGDEVGTVVKGDTVYVPRNTHHYMSCISEEKYEYLYFANWPKD